METTARLHERAWIDAMREPRFYPHRPKSVEIRETHISWIFLAGEYVYKVKKPVRFPFLDCSTLETRRHLCLEEVRLNQRLAPRVYEGVWTIVRSRNGLALRQLRHVDSPGEAVEYAVKMRRLPQKRMLDRLIGEQTVGTQEIRSIAETLADFHRGASRLNAFRYGSASAVSRMVMENIAECERFEGDMVSPAQVAGLATYNRVFVADHWELLNRRARDGLVCEGHGDLRCEQICLPDQDVVIFDCLEFSEALRYCDVACDLGFLVMDLERLGAAQLSSEVAGYYVQLSGDTEFMSLLDFYKCYRAVVRAKVECLRSRDTDASEDERQKARALARRYFSMACRYARCHDGRQAIIVVFGPAGSGKSTVAHALGQRLCYEVVGSDETRKRMAGASPTASRKADYGEGIYTEEFTRRTYNQLIVAAEQRLSEDQGVILDATFRHPEQRRRVREIAKSAGAPCLFVECRVAEKELLRRLRKRSQLSGVISDADVGIYSRQRTDFVQADEIPTENRLEADTTQGSESAIAAVEKWLARNCS